VKYIFCETGNESSLGLIEVIILKYSRTKLLSNHIPIDSMTNLYKLD